MNARFHRPLIAFVIAVLLCRGIAAQEPTAALTTVVVVLRALPRGAGTIACTQSLQYDQRAGDAARYTTDDSSASPRAPGAGPSLRGGDDFAGELVAQTPSDGNAP